MSSWIVTASWTVYAFVAVLTGVGGILFDESYYRSTAFNLSCSRHNCSNEGCKTEAGWNIYGYDVGCCGNYDGCCRLATRICYLHDKMCQCCLFGWLICGPECKPEPHCRKSQSRDIIKETKTTSPSSTDVDAKSSKVQEVTTARQQLTSSTDTALNRTSVPKTLKEILEKSQRISDINVTTVFHYTNNTADDNSTSTFLSNTTSKVGDDSHFTNSTEFSDRLREFSNRDTEGSGDVDE